VKISQPLPWSRVVALLEEYHACPGIRAGILIAWQADGGKAPDHFSRAYGSSASHNLADFFRGMGLR
jgi:hypothetical protein